MWLLIVHLLFFFFFKQKTEYDMRISVWSADVCSSDLAVRAAQDATGFEPALALAATAVALDPNNSWSHCALGVAKLARGAVAASADHFRVALRDRSRVA